MADTAATDDKALRTESTGFRAGEVLALSLAQPLSRTYKRAMSPLTQRILAVNIVALLILLGGFLYLGRYQDRLIEAELEALRSEARIVAAALGEGAVVRGPEEGSEIAIEVARQMLRRLVEASDTRTRLFSASGTLLVDSRVLGGVGGDIQIEVLPPPPDGSLLSRGVSRILDGIINTFPNREELPEYNEAPRQVADHYPDVLRALGGDISTNAWSAENGGLVLTVAVPVQRYKQVLGAVLLSRDGREIDNAIRSVRLDILHVFSVALLVTVGLSLYLASVIARPLHRLAVAAEHVRHGLSRQHSIPDFTHRNDEIGELSGALREMTEALWNRMDAIERFAADVAHEIKNPLSSLRSAVETVGRVQDPERQKRLMDIIQHDVQRLDRLISDISNASRLDAELSRAQAEPVDMGRMLQMLAEIYQATSGSEAPEMKLDIPSDENLAVMGIEVRLTQVIQNLIANAVSFSPPSGTVRLSVVAVDDTVEVRVEDDGPGIPEGKLEAIFDRFYTERPASESFGSHSGLGLSISKQIVQAHGGTIFARNRVREDGSVAGAIFTVRLHRA